VRGGGGDASARLCGGRWADAHDRWCTRPSAHSGHSGACWWGRDRAPVRKKMGTIVAARGRAPTADVVRDGGGDVIPRLCGIRCARSLLPQAKLSQQRCAGCKLARDRASVRGQERAGPAPRGRGCGYSWGAARMPAPGRVCASLRAAGRSQQVRCALMRHVSARFGPVCVRFGFRAAPMRTQGERHAGCRFWACVRAVVRSYLIASGRGTHP